MAVSFKAPAEGAAVCSLLYGTAAHTADAGPAQNARETPTAQTAKLWPYWSPTAFKLFVRRCLSCDLQPQLGLACHYTYLIYSMWCCRLWVSGASEGRRTASARIWGGGPI